MYRTIYGPVPSRRLGISLGVDIIPYKICSFNCIYCECGKNTQLTVERKDFIPVEVVIEEINDYLSKNPYPDFITVSGSGEPTLHLKLGELLKTLKKLHPDVKIAVLTNSSLIHLKEVREELYFSDVILPSLDAVLERSFKLINRPHSSIKLEEIIKGLIELRKEIKSVSIDRQIWLEIFIVEGINTDDENISALKKACIDINPDRIQLNTLDRPGAESWVKPASKSTLEMIKQKLDLPNVEIISKFKHRDEIKHYRVDVESAILELVERRPSTLFDISEILGIPVEEARKYMEILEHEKRIYPKIVYGENGNSIFYLLNREKKFS
jgi:wyosine [tRNA(Phe)-imidazoG37] synthetase (radical SAM superfamily)